MTDCDAENNPTIISSRTCTIPVSTLRTGPYSLANSASVYAKVTSFNAIGDSVPSAEGNGATIPIPPTEPNAPTTFVRNEVSTTKTQVAFSWTAPTSDGGSALLDYSI